MDKIIQVANISQETRNRVNPNDGRVYSPKGLSPTINTMGGGWRIPMYIQLKDRKQMDDLKHYEHPTKEQLIEYFAPRIRIRKSTPRTILRLMDMDDCDIDKIQNATESIVLKSGRVKTQKAITKTAQYALAGNSIVVGVLYHVFALCLLRTSPKMKNHPRRHLCLTYEK